MRCAVNRLIENSMIPWTPFIWAPVFDQSELIFFCTWITLFQQTCITPISRVTRDGKVANFRALAVARDSNSRAGAVCALALKNATNNACSAGYYIKTDSSDADSD